jgi:hypothetical protein
MSSGGFFAAALRAWDIGFMLEELTSVMGPDRILKQKRKGQAISGG